ncbi:MAG: Asp/Glu racemase [Amylibacter sp.]|jgi:maleate isomerase|tara:strand:+ start:34081 stop:34824 length:744 start_codon:yes stop_codon:yes gene_type:complete
MNNFSYELQVSKEPTIGLVVLQADQRIELDMRQLFDPITNMHITRIPSGAEVNTDTLMKMENDLPAVTSLLPRAANFDVVGYGCTSGTSVIGAAKISELIKSSCKTRWVTEPVSALIAACNHLGLSRIGLLSPYVEKVSKTLCETLQASGIETPIFGSFNEGTEEKVVQISPQSIFDAAVKLDTKKIDAIFISCTNLNTLPIIKEIENEIGKPVLSSNQVLAWHMAKLAMAGLSQNCIGCLFEVNKL